MQTEPKSDVLPGLREAGIPKGDLSDRVLFVEIPGPIELCSLERRSDMTFRTAGVAVAELKKALIAWEAAADEDYILVEPAWVPCDRGFKIPIPALRRSRSGMLQILEGAESAASLLSTDPVKDASFPILLACS
jgi:hypothetical protein